MMQIEHYDQLERWAQEHSYFQDGRVISMTPIPGLESDAVPTAVTVELGYPIKGTYEANSEMVYRAFRLLARGDPVLILCTANQATSSFSNSSGLR